jgi:hypothetical protein
MLLLSYIFPSLALLIRGKKLAAFICLILQLTIIGWIIASLYAVGSLVQEHKKKTGFKSKRSKSKPNHVTNNKFYFICKYCGKQKENLEHLIDPMYPCSRSPSKKHVPYEHGVQDYYFCKHCGVKKKKIEYLTDPMYNCNRSPTKKHEIF